MPIDVITSAGSDTYTVPPGVTEIEVRNWGAGGGGGNGDGGNNSGAGGGGGAYAEATLAVIPGTGISYTNGGGGAAETNGGDTSFGNSSEVVAQGGFGANSTTPGPGGFASSSTGDVTRDGGAGFDGVFDPGVAVGGGGGSSAGPSADGNDATDSNGATAPTDGGDGGDGGAASANGDGGNRPGGGGGGGGTDGGGGSGSGGAGGDGRIEIEYTVGFDCWIIGEVNGGWTDENDLSTDIFNSIDEAVADDDDYIQSPEDPDNVPYAGQLFEIPDPEQSGGHVLSYRYRKNTTGGDQVDLTVELREGYIDEGTPGSLIASDTHTDLDGSGWTDGELTLSGAEADSITDYGDLFVRFVANTDSSTTPRRARVSWVQFGVEIAPPPTEGVFAAPAKPIGEPPVALVRNRVAPYFAALYGKPGLQAASLLRQRPLLEDPPTALLPRPASDAVVSPTPEVPDPPTSDLALFTPWPALSPPIEPPLVRAPLPFPPLTSLGVPSTAPTQLLLPGPLLLRSHEEPQILQRPLFTPLIPRPATPVGAVLQQRFRVLQAERMRILPPPSPLALRFIRPVGVIDGVPACLHSMDAAVYGVSISDAAVYGLTISDLTC